MSRTTIIVLLALGATFAGFVLASNAQQLRGSDSDVTPGVAAGPQTAKLDWEETYGAAGDDLVFTVESLEVTKAGWNARIGVENRTEVGWKITPGSMPDGAFGLQLFETGDKQELDQRNRRGTLPAVRAATRYEPELPRTLEPKASWEGTISAPGALLARAWVRVVFGTFVAVGKPPDDIEPTVVWITDNAYQLHA